jgi:hypothetical protein
MATWSSASPTVPRPNRVICVRPRAWPTSLTDAPSRAADGSAAAFLRSAVHTAAVGARRAGRRHHLRHVAQPAACAVLRWLGRRRARAASVRSGVGVRPVGVCSGPQRRHGGRRLHSRTPGGFADRRGGLGPVSEGACTGAGSLFCVGAVFGPDRRLACRQYSEPRKADVGDAEPDGRLRPAAWHRVCGWLRVRPPGRWLRHPQRQLHSRPWSASGAG